MVFEDGRIGGMKSAIAAEEHHPVIGYQGPDFVWRSQIIWKINWHKLTFMELTKSKAILIVL
jgi:hypothetical protein